MSADFSDAHIAAKRLAAATARLQGMVKDVSHGRQVKEFIGDMKKNLMAKYVVRALKAGEGIGAAEATARADHMFQEELELLQAQYEAAEHAITSWQAEMASYEASRSLLSFNRETLRQLPE